MQILDGKQLAQTVLTEIAQEVALMTAAGNRAPHLSAVLVGDDPASQAYVRNKIRSCAQAGFQSSLVTLPSDVTQEELLDVVRELNTNTGVDGFIVQLPLPKYIDNQEITLAIAPEKDVDGFTPANYGRMALGLPCYLPATPYGIMVMLQRYGIDTAGKHCVVVGRSHIVGAPISIMLAQKGNPGDCTVTLAHSRTQDLAAMTRQADILIAAIGKAHFITAEMVKDGVVVIDVGINRIEDASAKSGSRLVGDVDFEGVAAKASAMTPVPGGVGPLTVAALMLNTLDAARKNRSV
jgi:methylenetetrahydrofolate dehydrogenase (NADP+)/methenyltetrahydrofolate cyclohydrolase